MATSIQQDFKTRQSLVVRSTATLNSVDTSLTTATFGVLGLPPINLNFTKTSVLDPRIQFTRSSGATYVGPDGFIKYAATNQPRIDYDPVNVGYCRGLLIEEQKTNLISYSSNFTQWNLSGNAIGVVQNATMSPDGSQNASYLTNTAGAGSQMIAPGLPGSYIASATYVQSIFAKPVSTYATGGSGAGTIVFQNYINGAFVITTFDCIALTSNVSYGTGVSSITPVGNGWVRCTVALQTYRSTDSFGVIYLGGWGAYSNTMTVALWGAQLEINQYPNNGWYSGVPTSYIPTNGAAVTRANDVAIMIGQSITNVLNQNNGTMFAEWMQGYNGYSSLVQSSSGIATITSNNPNVGYNGYGFPTNPLYAGYWAFMQGRNYNNYSLTYSVGLNQFAYYGQIYRIAGTYDPNNLWDSFDGAPVSNGNNSVVSANMGYQLNQILLGQSNVGGVPNFQMNGWLRKFQYWPQTLPPALLPQLSTTTVYSTSNFVNAVISHVANTTTFILNQGLVTGNNLEISDVDHLYTTNLTRPTQAPTLNLNFLKGQLDSRISFSRASGGSYVGANGFIQYAGVNQPRFDYSTTSTGTCQGLLIEEQRTNLYYYNTQISTQIALWTGSSNSGISGLTVQENAIQSPDGTYNAALLSNTPNINAIISPGRTNYTSNTWYTKSVYAKWITGSPYLYFQEILSDNSFMVTSFNIQIGRIISSVYGSTTGTSSIVDAGNGWYRCSKSFLTLTTSSSVLSGDSFFIGGYGSTPTPTTQSIWGVQLEIASGNNGAYYPTSLIVTQGSSVTRSIDTAFIVGQSFVNSFANPVQGTMIIDYVQYYNYQPNIGNTPGLWGLGMSSAIGNYAYGYGLFLYTGATYPIMYGRNSLNNNSYGNAIVPVGVNTGTQYVVPYTINKIACSWSATNMVIAGFGQISYSTNSASPYILQFDYLVIGNEYFGGLGTAPNGTIRRLTFYPEVLPTTTLLALTT